MKLFKDEDWIFVFGIAGVVFCVAGVVVPAIVMGASVIILFFLNCKKY